MRPITCNYCDKIGHCEAECRNKRSKSASTNRQLTNYASNSEYDDYSGLFVMWHRANSMMAFHFASISNSEDVWFIDSGASHHMTSHEEWFRDLRTPNPPGFIETGDDTTHPIRYIGNVHVQCPIWERRRANLHQECLARAHNNKEFGLDRPNRGARHANPLQ